MVGTIITYVYVKEIKKFVCDILYMYTTQL